MPRIGLAYERPSRVSQVLVIGFSIAVVAMAGWLVTVLLVSGDANTSAADQTELRVAAAALPPVSTRVAPEPIRLGAPAAASATPDAAQMPSPAQPPSWPTTPFAVTRPPGVGQAIPPQSGGPTYTASALAPGETGARVNDRTGGRAGDGAELPIDAAGEAPDVAEVIPLPPPKPKRVASIPMPRPRPHLESDDVPQERSFFDFLVNHQR
jgi:hypothetical protein